MFGRIWSSFFRCSTLNRLLRMALAYRGDSFLLHKCVSPSKSYPGLNIDARTQRAPKALPAHGGYAARDRRPIRFARQFADQASAHRADESCVIRSRAARRELAR